MGLFNIPLLLAAATAYLVVYTMYVGTRIRRDGLPLKKPPNTWPLVGNGIVFIQERQKLFEWFTKVERLFGHETVQITVPTLPPGVIINGPGNLDFVFKNEGIFAKGSFVKRRSWDLFGFGIINADGDLWKIQRKAGLNFLSTANLQVLTNDALPQYLSESVDHLRARASSEIVDLQSVFHEITTQLMGRMAYNMEMHADDDFGVAFDYASGATAERFQNPLWPVTEMLFGSRLRKSIAIVKTFGSRIVTQAVADKKEKQAIPAEQSNGESRRPKIFNGSLIQSFLESLDDEKVVADAALNYLSAGRDTTAQALTWTFHLLSMNPDVTARVRVEVQEFLSRQLATKGSVAELAALIQDLSALPYTHAVFNESLRLYPPVPFEIKQAMQATTLPDGTFLPQGSVVVWCPWAMNRSHVSWGADADVFRPERWLADGKVLNKTAAEFPVFNGGPRTCLGKKMAEVIAAQVITTMVLHFDFEAAESGDRVSKSSLTLPMKGGLPCHVHAREIVGSSHPPRDRS